jgi:rhamnosyltransferase
MTPSISVIVRVKDRAHTIRSALESVRAQDQPAELIVVDSGSTDASVAIAREYADQIIEIPTSEFTYGGALNTGAQAASGAIHVALSAHCELPHKGWLSVVAEHHQDPDVAATTGHLWGPWGAKLRTPYRQAGDPAVDRNPYWGYSNHAGSWRADLWATHPFSTELIACEDKEWAAHVRRFGKVVVMDPRLNVTSKHRSREGLDALYRRAIREAEAMAQITGKRPATLREIVSEYFGNRKEDRSLLLQLFNPYRVVERAGRYVGERRAHPA